MYPPHTMTLDTPFLLNPPLPSLISSGSSAFNSDFLWGYMKDAVTHSDLLVILSTTVYCLAYTLPLIHPLCIDLWFGLHFYPGKPNTRIM